MLTKTADITFAMGREKGELYDRKSNLSFKRFTSLKSNMWTFWSASFSTRRDEKQSYNFVKKETLLKLWFIPF